MLFKKNKKTLSIIFNEQLYNVDSSRTLLDSLLREGAIIKYNCGVGKCKQCKVQILDGEFRSNSSESLACQIYPLTNLTICQDIR